MAMGHTQSNARLRYFDFYILICLDHRLRIRPNEAGQRRGNISEGRQWPYQTSRSHQVLEKWLDEIETNDLFIPSLGSASETASSQFGLADLKSVPKVSLKFHFIFSVLNASCRQPKRRPLFSISTATGSHHAHPRRIEGK